MIAIQASAYASEVPVCFEALWVPGPNLECNSGGPRSRTRKLGLRATLLGEGAGHVSCPKVRQVALGFGKEDPVVYVRRLSESLGYPSPEAARDTLMSLTEPLACCACDHIAPTPVARTRPETVLEKALILGLSTAWLFDPARPVIWTRASLTRRLALYDVQGFYA